MSTTQAARPSKPMELFIGIPIETGNGKPLSQEEWVLALKRAGQQRNWVMTPDPDGTVRAHLSIRTHKLDVLITLHDNTFEVSYLDSTGLGFAENPNDPQRPLIHPQYNNWVKNLINDIRTELLRL